MFEKALIWLAALALIGGCSANEVSVETSSEASPLASSGDLESTDPRQSTSHAPLPLLPSFRGLSSKLQQLQSLTCITKGKDTIWALIKALEEHPPDKGFKSVEQLKQLKTNIEALKIISTDAPQQREMTLDEFKAAGQDLSRSLGELIRASTSNDTNVLPALKKQIQNGVQNLSDAQTRLVDECSNN